MSFCLACGEAVVDTDACPLCGTMAAPERFAALQAAARPALLFGYRYRRIYEQSTRRRFHLNWDELWSFIAIAVASGVIGNASWDAVKVVVRRAIETYRSRSREKEHNAYELLDEAELELAFRYFQDYLAGGRTMGPDLFLEIQKEQSATELAPILRATAHGERQFSSAEEAEALVRSAFEIPLRTAPEDFTGLWSQVEIKR